MDPFETRGFSDQLNIATPEQVELQFPIAGIGSRFVAVLIDTVLHWVGFGILVLLLVWAAFHFGPAAAKSDEASDKGKVWAIALIMVLYFGVQFGYFTLFEGLWRGQTPGKRIMKLRVIKETGRQITFFESMTRNFIRIIDHMPSLYFIGIVSMLCNKMNKRLGDFAAGTVVVHERQDDQPMLYRSTTLMAPEAIHLQPWYTPPATENAMFSADAVARLDANDLRVIETFFARALDLPMETRAQMAWKIAQQMAAKMQTTLPEGNPERALEAISHAMRGGAARF